jgi:parvulin-like peptidyl-prolyl isomerase
MRRWKPTIHEEEIDARNFFDGDGPDRILAEAGDERIGLREFRDRLPIDMLRRLPEQVALFRIRRHLVENALFDRLLILEGLRLGYGNRPEVEREVLRVQNGLLLEKILPEYVYVDVSATDEEIKAYYQDHPKEFSHPARAKVRSILVTTEAEAGLIRDAVGQGKDFGTLAREQSKDGLTSGIGGEMGWMVEGKARPPFSNIIFTLPLAEVAVAKDGDGYRVIQVVGREEAKLRPLDEVRADASAKALALKQRQEVRRWIAKLRDGSTIRLLEAGIAEAEQAYQEQLKARIEQRRGPQH